MSSPPCSCPTASALEDHLQRVLNLAVTQVARERCVAERRSSLQSSSGQDTVNDLPARGCEVQVSVAVTGGTAVAEHRMIEQVEELKPELQLCALAQYLRQTPVLVEREVYITDARGVALPSVAE